MINIKPKDMAIIETALNMGSGYVLNFSDSSFQSFVAQSVDIDISDSRYSVNGSSKAKRLRSFIKLEQEFIVKTLLIDLLEYAEEHPLAGIYMASGADKVSRIALIKKCQAIVSDSVNETMVPICESLDNNYGKINLILLSSEIKRAIDINDSRLGLDRLHTYFMGFLRHICSAKGIICTEEKPIHSMVAELIKYYKSSGYIESECSELILKSQISISEKLNDVRNRRSLAHDNPILKKEESHFILASVVVIIKFIRDIESSQSIQST
jgi:hypothetical protein